MQSSGYQLLALAARALFVLLAALVALRAAGMLLREHRSRRKLLRTLPDAGMVGEMRDVESDQGYPLPREGTLGGGRACDIRLRGLKRRQVDFAYVDGKGILLTPCHRRGDTLLDGEPIHRGAYALHGAILRVGGYTLRIRLFAGLNVPHPAQYQEQHWQPVFEEELYGSGVMGVPAPYPQQAYDAPQQWMATQPLPVIHMPEDGQEAPLPFGAAGEAEPRWMQTQPIPVVRPMPEAEPYPQTAPYPAEPWPEEEQLAPAPFEGEDAAPADDGMPAPFAMPARHRRSDRRREL